MKLRFVEFEALAQSLGHSNGRSLLTKLGYKELLDNLAINNKIGYEAVKDLYNNFGANVVEGIIDFEGDSIENFERKYIKIGNKLV